MWAVLWTDLVQFVIKMTAVIVLAVYAVRAVGGIDVMKAKLAAHFGSETAALSVLPVTFTPQRDQGVRVDAAADARRVSVRAVVGRVVSRRRARRRRLRRAAHLLARSTERDGVLATLFFQVAHYALRPWPWIVTGLATVILYPGSARRTKEAGYVQAFVDLLPTPWRGFMMAGFAAAYMSHRGHASQLGRVVSRQRLLQALHRTRRDREALRRRLRAGRPSLLFLASIGRHVAALDRRKARGSSCSRSARARGSC